MIETARLSEPLPEIETTGLSEPSTTIETGPLSATITGDQQTMISPDLFNSTVTRWWAMPNSAKDWSQVGNWCHGGAMLAMAQDQSDDLLTLSSVAHRRAMLLAEKELPMFLRRQAE